MYLISNLQIWFQPPEFWIHCNPLLKVVDAKRLCKKEDDGLDEEEEVGVSHKAWSFPFFLNPQIPTRASLVKAAETFLNAKGGLMAKHGKHSRRRKWIVVPDELCSKTLSSITLNCEKIYGFICIYPRGSNTKHLLKTYKMEMTGWHARSLIAFHFANYNW